MKIWPVWTAAAGISLVGLSLAFSAPDATVPTGSIQFHNAAGESGLDFVLENCPTAQKRLIETMAGGMAAFDYNGDGLPDIYFTNGASVPSLEKDSLKYNNRMYRNLGNFRFKDVTQEAGLAGSGYSIGAAAGDYDNDGHIDLFVAGVGRNILYRNRGDCTFEDITAKAGIRSDSWSVDAVWFDYDNDGRLDLFVVNYLEWSPKLDLFCGDSARRVYCHPGLFTGLPNRLYHNQGDGTFKDVSVESGIAAHVGKGMSAAVADYDHDGFLDVAVTNDKMPNFLFHNLRNGRFEEAGFQTGAALLDSGSEISTMGIDFRDIDNDGFPDLAMTALSGETFALFRNLGKGSFADNGDASAMARLSRKYSGWGNGVFDFDNDGWKDIFTANSHVNDRVEETEATEYKQPDAIFLNRGGGVFADVSSTAGPEFLVKRAHRGAAFADFNRDGRMDAVVSVLGERPELWENVSSTPNTWLTLRLRGVKSNRDGIGATIDIDGQQNEMTSAVGYASSSHDGVHFGIGKRQQVRKIEIKWPSGIQQVLENVRTNQVLDVNEPQH